MSILNGRETSFDYTDLDGGHRSYYMTVFQEDYSRTVNYGTEEKPFRLRFNKILKIGFIKR